MTCRTRNSKITLCGLTVCLVNPNQWSINQQVHHTVLVSSRPQTPPSHEAHAGWARAHNDNWSHANINRYCLICEQGLHMYKYLISFDVEASLKQFYSFAATIPRSQSATESVVRCVHSQAYNGTVACRNGANKLASTCIDRLYTSRKVFRFGTTSNPFRRLITYWYSSCKHRWKNLRCPGQRYLRFRFTCSQQLLDYLQRTAAPTNWRIGGMHPGFDFRSIVSLLTAHVTVILSLSVPRWDAHTCTQVTHPPFIQAQPPCRSPGLRGRATYTNSISGWW